MLVVLGLNHNSAPVTVRERMAIKKDEMEAISRASVFFRNTTGIVSPIHVSQFNRSCS